MKLEVICSDIVEKVILNEEDKDVSLLSHPDLIFGIQKSFSVFSDKNKKKIKSPLWQVTKLGGQLRQLTLII